MLTFDEVLSLLNHSRTTFIDPTPIHRSDAGWLLYQGEHRVPMATYPFRLLYLQAKISKEETAQAARIAQGKNHLFIVYAPSLEQRAEFITSLFPEHASYIHSTKDYVSSFIKDELSRYISIVKAHEPKYYIDPAVEVPTGFSRKIPNPLLGFLRDPEPKDAGALGVLLAEPGQGKTYMSQYLVFKIAERSSDLVPIIIDSTQWRGLSPEDLGSLFRTITHSFHHFEVPISWVEGHEEQFLRVTLKAGMFRIVFDGFDEYVLQNKGAVRPLEVLEALLELAEATGARILITSRTSFWDMNLPEADLRELASGRRLFVYQILPFDLSHARNYFEKRLSTQGAAEQAVRLYGLLRSEDEAFVGRGFVLNLIADLVERGLSNEYVPSAGKNALRWLTEALCERETLRQQLPLTKSDQVAVFKQFAAELAVGEQSETATLEYAIGIVRQDLKQVDLATCIEKLKPHPILEYHGKSDCWGFRQAQTQVLFLAEVLREKKDEDLRLFIGHLKLIPEIRQDLAATLVALIRHSGTESESLATIRQLVIAISGQTEAHPAPVDGRRLSAALLLTAVDHFMPRGSSHRDRTDHLRALCGGGAVSGQVFTGTIARFDLKGVDFIRCVFEHVNWANCQFNGTTRFHECKFVGGGLLHSDEFGLTDLDTSELDEEARAWVNNASIAAGRKAYTADDLRADLTSVINKFVGKSGLTLKTVAERNLTKGPIASSRYRREIVDLLLSSVLEPHSISGTPDKGFHVRESAADSVRFFSGNGVFTGSLAQAFDRLKGELRL